VRSLYDSESEFLDDERHLAYDFDAELMEREDARHDWVRLSGEPGPVEVEE
jgi:hypothetical protein